MLGGDADAGIGHRKHTLPIDHTPRRSDRPAFRGVANGVGQKIANGAVELVADATDRLHRVDREVDLVSTR